MRSKDIPFRSMLLLFASAVIISLLSVSCAKWEVAIHPSPMPQAAVDTPAGVQIGYVTINYRLIDDNGSQAHIQVEYSTDNGRTYHLATLSGGDGKDYLACVGFPGYGHTVIWDTASDRISRETCIIKISPTNLTTYLPGTSGKSGPFQVDNLRDPVITWVSKPEGTVRQVPLTFTWKFDSTQVPAEKYFYGVDGGPLTNVTTNTSVTIPTLSFGDHTFRVFAQSYFLYNSNVLEATFTCDNAAANLPPTVEITAGPSGSTLDNTPTFEYIGYDSDGSVTGYFVSIDTNPPDIWTTSVSWTSPELPSNPYTFYVMAQDNEGKNSNVVSQPFTVEGSPYQPPTIYVDGSVSSSGNGTSWGTAFKTIQEAIDNASNAQTVLVADGTYSGFGNTDLDFKGKDIELHSDGGAGACIIDCENSSRGFYFHTGETALALVSGFTIRNGYSADNGGGIYLGGMSCPTITYCTIENCMANNGGGIYSWENSSASIIFCNVINNFASCNATYCIGGGIACSGSALLLENSTISFNEALSTGGGAVTSFGGGLCFEAGSDGTVEGCVVENNRCNATDDSYAIGGGICIISSSTVICNCTISNNESTSENRDSFGGGISYRDNANGRITRCRIENNKVFSRYILLPRWGYLACGGGVYLRTANPTFESCVINNNMGNQGGAVYVNNNSQPQFINCEIANNKAESNGGVIFCYWSSTPVFVNCVLANNEVNNSGTGGGGAVYCEWTTNCILRNTIIWGNINHGVGGNSNQVYIHDSDSDVTLYHCDYDDSSGHWYGDHLPILDAFCINLDPLFSPGTFQLSATSPCMDIGNNTYIDNTGVTVDLLGLPRKQDGPMPPDGSDIVDIGAYEYQP